ncbi:MAG TPA: ABC transporter ATP-binding protein [Bryobacteraceae bacterium]|nr:ABC transporter ATP-binding protein [Bryobacteraceae bacterium]
MMNVITCENVWKTFYRRTGQKLVRDHLASWFGASPRPDHAFHALKGVSFQVAHGQSLAVIGSNGAGKSTLLSVVTGLTRPEKGSVQVQGRIAALLELGSGFHPDLTGRENVHLNAALLGFSEKQTRMMFDAIVDFSGVKDFIDEPLRTYSSGMALRLAFSVAVNVDPEIFIIDEVLTVGDQDFQARCSDRIRAFHRMGRTFLCVSHSKPMVMELCERAVWLDHGEVMMYGKIEDVFEAYEGRAALT